VCEDIGSSIIIAVMTDAYLSLLLIRNTGCRASKLYKHKRAPYLKIRDKGLFTLTIIDIIVNEYLHILVSV